MNKRYWPDEEYFDAPCFKLNTLPWMNSFSHFSAREFADDEGHVFLLKKVVIRLQLMRIAMRAPLIINSGYRNPAHNARVGGSPNSMHLYGHAVDISLYNLHGKNHDGATLEAVARRHGFNGIGRDAPTSNSSGFIHIDMRNTPAEWGSWGKHAG